MFLHPDTAHAGGPNTSYDIRKMVYFRLKIKCGNIVTTAVRKIMKKKIIKNSAIVSNLDKITSGSSENDTNSLIDEKDNFSDENLDQNNDADLNINKFIDNSVINNNNVEVNINNHDTSDNNNDVNFGDISKENLAEKSAKSDRILSSHTLPSSTSIDTNSKSSIFVDWNSVTLAHSSDMWADLMGVKTLEGV